MKTAYDTYYETEDLFGAPYPELISFFEQYPKKGSVLDLGCGQGRNTIALARLGYAVTGIEHSTVGIDQMNHIAQAENLNLKGQVEDIYAFNSFEKFQITLLDSMFHFSKKDRAKETRLIQNIVLQIKKGSLVVVCIQDSGQKVHLLNEAIDFERKLNRLMDKKFSYIFEDKSSGHKSHTAYRMIVVEK